jgi:hypothetical protein
MHCRSQEMAGCRSASKIKHGFQTETDVLIEWEKSNGCPGELTIRIKTIHIKSKASAD